MMMRPLSFILVGVLGGCTPAAEAPTEFGDLSLFTFSEFESADDAYLGEALINYEASARSLFDLDGDRGDRTTAQPILYPDDWGSAVGPEGVDPEAQIAITLARVSDHPVRTHASAVLLPDQSPLEPSAPEHDRSYASDTDCWAAAECGRIDTENTIRKSNILYTIVYDTEKDFRRLTLPDGRDAMVARTWNDEVAMGENGVNSIDQNYAAEVFIETPDDSSRTLRMMSIWVSSTLSGNPDVSVQEGVLRVGLDDLFKRHDEVHSGESE